MTVAKNHPNSQSFLLNVSNTDLHLSPEQFEQLCRNNPDLKLQLTEDGKLVVESLEAFQTKNISHKYELVELTSEETARKLEALKRYQERRQKIVDCLTPEELETFDRQFDEMLKFLEESRV
jgi:hypothetical protein